MTIAVGDIIAWSSISEHGDSAVLSSAVGTLFGELRTLLLGHGGTVGNYAGDAFFGLWELEHFPDAADRAIEFVLAADELVAELAPRLQVSDLEGRPISMGWGVVSGEASTISIAGAATSVLGDSANLAFRLSGLAGRDGRERILASAKAIEGIRFPIEADRGTPVTVKGRSGVEQVCGIRRSR